MKNVLFAAMPLFLAAAVCSAQPGTMYTHQAGPSDGKVLTINDITMSRDVYPSRMMCMWSGDDAYSYMDMASRKMVTMGLDGKERESKGGPMEGPGRRPGGPGRGPGFEAQAMSGEKMAFVKDGSLYVKEGKDGKEVLVAKRENDQISYGVSVSRNEFGINGGLFWSPEGTRLAFYRKDESRVTDFPLLDITTRTGSLKSIKYPMNGMESEEIKLGIYDLASGKTAYCAVDDFGYDRYLTNISWAPDDKYVFIQVLDRSQSHMHLNMYRADNGEFVRTLLTEDNDKFVEPENPLEFIKGRYEFIYRTDNRDGYKNLYLCDTLGTVKRITPCAADVAYVANDGSRVFYTSAEVSPVENHLFSVKLKFSKKGVSFSDPARHTFEEGWHNVSLNESCTYFIDTYSSFNIPSVTSLKSVDGKVNKEINRSADPLAAYATGEVTFGTVKSADGKFDNYYRLFKPMNFDPSKKYPVVVYVYGGPHSQMVQDTWLGNVRMWEMLMAQKGYIVYVQDNRGTSNRGAEYEKAIHDQCGQCEMADQMVGVNMLKSLPYVDADRIGVHGWSYGGFMTISLITNYPETFKVAVAGGPVIDWKWYEVMYGERYMDTEATNPEGFAKTSLINKAKDLKGKLLICQGAIDNTVVWEHSLSFVQECVKNNVQLDYFPYPCSEHNVAGGWRVHLNTKITQYFEDNL